MTYVHAEAEAVLMVSTVLHWSNTGPQSLAPVSIAFVLLQQLEKFQEDDAITHYHYTQLLEVGLLCRIEE